MSRRLVANRRLLTSKGETFPNKYGHIISCDNERIEVLELWCLLSCHTWDLGRRVRIWRLLGGSAGLIEIELVDAEKKSWKRLVCISELFSHGF